MINGASVTVVTRSSEGFREVQQPAAQKNQEYLQQANIEVICQEGFQQKFAVIDGKTIWYGSVNLLDSSQQNESVMRLEDAEVAGELIGLV